MQVCIYFQVHKIYPMITKHVRRFGTQCVWYRLSSQSSYYVAFRTNPIEASQGDLKKKKQGEEERKAGLSSEKEQPLGGRFVSIWPLRCAEKQRKVALRVFQQNCAHALYKQQSKYFEAQPRHLWFVEALRSHFHRPFN